MEILASMHVKPLLDTERKDVWDAVCLVQTEGRKGAGNSRGHRGDMADGVGTGG